MKTSFQRFQRKLKRKVALPRRTIRYLDLARMDPLCRNYGFSRGEAIDRVLIGRFLNQHSEDIHGRTLEIKNANYTRRFGGPRVTQADTLDIDTSNKTATIFDDLRTLNTIADETYDCIILTQTLQLLDDDAGALRHLHRVLRPGGTLLLTVPCISKVGRRDDDGQWHRFYTNHGLAYLLKDYFDSPFVEVSCHGNLPLATAFLHGLAVEDVAPSLFAHDDPEFPIISAARAIKSSALA